MITEYEMHQRRVTKFSLLGDSWMVFTEIRAGSRMSTHSFPGQHGTVVVSIRDNCSAALMISSVPQNGYLHTHYLASNFRATDPKERFRGRRIQHRWRCFTQMSSSNIMESCMWSTTRRNTMRARKSGPRSIVQRIRRLCGTDSCVHVYCTCRLLEVSMTMEHMARCCTVLVSTLPLCSIREVNRSKFFAQH